MDAAAVAIVTRRRMLLGGAALAGAALALWPRTEAMASVISRALYRSITLYNINTRERLSGTYWREGRYLPDAFAQIDYFMRDFREHAEAPTDPFLIDVVWALQQTTRARGDVYVTSGFRTWETNEYLRRILPGVAMDSYHLRAQAMDITVPGVPLRWLRQAALELRAGGVGYYPRHNFVHVDTGPLRTW